MSLIKCPKCGELFSDSYKSCPFCEEDEELFEAKRGGKPGRRVIESRSRGPKILGPAMVAVVLLLAAVLVYAFFGDKISAVLTDDGGGEQEQEHEEPIPQETGVSVRPAAVSLAEGDVLVLTASGARSYVWSSSDENVVMVDETGSLTAVGAGSAIITVSDAEGETSAQCAVTVKGTEDGDPIQGTEGGDLSLKTIYGPISRRDDGKFDLTMRVGEVFALEVEGVSGKAVWSTSDASVVTVDDDGTLHPAAKGEAEVTVTVGGEKAVCIVRVNW